MTIRDKDAFMRGLWDWKVLDGCFGDTHIRPMDVDGLIERRRHFLFLEAKPAGGTLTKGQEITLTELSLQPRTCCVVFYGDPQEETVERITVFTRGEARDQADASLDGLRTFVSLWYAWADGQRVAADA